jgi:hypothetical protein
MRRICCIGLVVMLSAAASGCRSDEGRGIAGAVETFLKFGLSNEERVKAPAEKRGELPPHLPERSRLVKEARKGQVVLWVEVDMPHKLEGDEVVSTLEFEIDRLMTETDYPAIELRAMPGGLLAYGKVMGGASVSRTNSGVTSREVWSSVRDESPPLTDEQYQALVALELEMALSPRGGKARALQKIREIHGRATIDQAIKAAGQRWNQSKKRR